MLKRLVYNLFNKLHRQAIDYRMKQKLKELGIPLTVQIYNSELIGSIKIGEYTYVNNGTTFSSGETSKVTIGQYCAIGRYVHITSKGHSLEVPTADEEHKVNKHVEKDTVVGDYAIIGANSVVTKDVRPFEIVGGVPARHIRFNTEHYRYTK